MYTVEQLAERVPSKVMRVKFSSMANMMPEKEYENFSFFVAEYCNLKCPKEHDLFYGYFMELDEHPAPVNHPNKYALGQEVWFMYDNKIKSKKIESIKFSSDNFILYEIYVAYNETNGEIHDDFFEAELFPTKQALKDSL